MRRLAISFLVAPLAALAGLSLLSAVASADAESGATPAEDLAPVDVFEVSGLLDEVMVEAIEDAITTSEANGSQALILQLNTGGAVVSDERMTQLLQRVADAKVAIGLWVGPSRDAAAS